MFFGAKKDQPLTFDGQRSVDGVINYVFEKMRAAVNSRLNKGESTKQEGSKQEGSKQEGSKQEGSSDDKDVVVLKDGTFEAALKDTNDLWLIEFYGNLTIYFYELNSTLVRTLQKFATTLECSSITIERESQVWESRCYSRDNFRKNLWSSKLSDYQGISASYRFDQTN
jgi:hypothetical protein